jgi:hypothetical protein
LKKRSWVAAAQVSTKPFAAWPCIRWRRHATYSKPETLALLGTGTLFGTESADIHHEGTMVTQIELAGFTHIKRVYDEPDVIARVSIFRARR